MLERTWPYGTRKRVKVLDFIRTWRQDVLIVAEDDPQREAHAICYGPGHFDPIPAVGTMGEILFTAGGPTGGFWDFSVCPF